MPRLTPVSAADVETPDQKDGTAAGLGHEAENALFAGSPESTGTGPDVDAPEGALPHEWPDLPEDADTLAPPDLESPATRLAEEEPEPEVTGFDPETSVELVEERDEYSRTFENEDGTYSTDFSQEPLHFEAEDGSWQELDPSLVPENSLTWTSSAGAKEVTFAANADADELARMELEDGYSLSFSLEGASGAQGEVLEDDPDTIVYPEALPGTDIELKSLRGGGVKETIWLHEAPATDEDAVWRFPLELEGLEPVLLEDGSIDLVDGDDEPVGHIPAGYMEDSDIDPRSGDGAWSEAVDFELLREGEGWVLQVRADFDWLTDEERVYPVGVDPTTAWNYNASQDTYVQTGFNTSRHTEQELKAGTYNGGSTRTASYLRFNAMVSALSNHKIFEAELYLFNHWSYSCTPSPVYVHEVTQAWTQTSISNFPGPNYNSTALGSRSFARGWMPAGASSSSCPGRYEAINLGTRGRDLVQAWVDGNKTNHGITVRASNTSNSGWKKFGSRESWGAPYMTVTYSPYRADYAFAQNPPVFDPIPQANRGTNVNVRVTNRGDATWTPSNGYELGYQVFDQSGNRVYHVAPTTKMPRNVSTGQTATVRAKIDPLPPGTWTIKFDMTHKAQSFVAWGSPMTAQVRLVVPDLPPQLLDYSPRDGARVVTLTPEFTALGRNNDAWPTAGMEFWFNFCDGEWPDWECVDSGWQKETSWQLPGDRMEWGNQYWWNVFVRDGSQFTESGWLRLIAEPDQPSVTSNLAGGGSGEHGTVNALIGNYTQSVTDAAVPTAGLPLSVTRTYNSADPRQDGMFGAGWSTRFDMRLAQDVDGTGNVVVTYPDGRQHRFARNTDGSYTPPSGMHAVLAETDTGWRLMDKASTSYVFDDTGLLLEITDHRGRSQAISHDTSGQVSTVTADGGRFLDFTWADGRVSSVTARGGDDSAEWTYTYDGQRLVQACNPEAECASYTYEDGSHYRAAVTDANPYGYWRFEETDGQSFANEVPRALGGEDAAMVGNPTGSDGVLAGVETNALAAGAGAYAELPEAILHRLGTRLTVEAWFSTTQHGTVIGALDKPTSPTERTQLVYVGTDGKLRAQFWTTTGGVAPITTDGTVNDGQWHHVALTSDGTTQTLYLDGEEIGTKSGQVEHRNTKFVYVGHGMGNSGWPATLPSLGNFPFQGQIDEVAIYQRPLHPDTVALHHASGVDPADRMKEATTPQGNLSDSLSFDESTSRVRIHNDHNGGKWVYSDRLYNGDVKDEEPQVTAEVTITDPRGATSASRYDALEGHRRVTDTDQLGHQTVYTYDTGGFLADTTLPNGARLRFFNNERGNRLGQMSCRDVEATDCHWEWFSFHHAPDDPFDPRNDQLISHLDARSEHFLDATYRTWWGYNAYGDQTSETGPATEDFPEGRTVRYFYTDDSEPATDGGTAPAGLLVESWDADEGKTRFSHNTHGDITRVREPSGVVTEYTYDGLGRVESSTVITGDHPDGITTAFTYDSAGRVLTETGPAVTNELTGTTHQQRTTHVYDKDGNPVRQTVSDLTGGDPERVTMLAYNRYGHLVAQTDPEGHTEHYGYDLTGAQTYHQDAAGTEFRTTYTDRGHLAEHIIEGWVGHPDEDNEPAPLVLQSHSYDPNGNLASVTDAVGRTISYTYYADGLPAQTIATGAMLNDADEPQDVVLEEHFYDPAGNPVHTVTGDGTTRTDMVWDAASRLVSGTFDPEGLARSTSYIYDARDNVLEMALTDPSERVERARYAYNAAGVLIEEAVRVDGEDLLTSYEVNELGLVTAVTDPRGNEDGATAADFTARMSYDELGRLIEERLPEVEIERHGEPSTTGSPTSRFGYDLVGNLTHQRDAEGNTSVFGYDLLGQQTDAQVPTFTGADGEPVTPQAQTSYDALGRMVEQTDARGNTRGYTWDQLGHLAHITDPELTGFAEAGEWTFFHNPVGEMLAAVDPLEARTEATYDDLGRQVTDTQIERVPAAAAYTTHYVYDVMGNQVSATDPLGNESSSAYNSLGELVEDVNAVGEATTFEYDLAGRLYKVTDPAETRSVSEFDLAGRLVRTRILDAEDNELRAETTEYDAAGLPIEQTDPLGNVVRTEYNAQGLPTSLIEPVSGSQTITTSFGYDALGQQTRITDGRGNSTHTTYTPTGEVASLIEPTTDAAPELADRTWTTFYDAGGNPVRQEVPGGVVRERTYNELGGLTRETATGAAVSTEDRGFGYDLLGRPTQIGTPNGHIEIVYDDRGNQVQFLGPDTVSFEGMAPGTTISYDAAGRADTRLDLTGVTTFGYDPAGRVIEQHDPVTGTDLSIDYDQTGQVASVTTDGGSVRSFSYDPLSQLIEDTLVSSVGETTVSTAYAYDAAGNITERSTQDTVPSGRHKYAYDQASRLIAWTSPDEEETEYSWDASGNRVQAGTETFEFDERNQLVSSSGGDTWVYNPDGTLKSQFVDGELRTPQFDGFERMVSAGNGSGEYSYDALGRVAERGAGGQEHTFVYQGLGNNPIAVLDGTDTPVSEYGRDVSGGLTSVADQGQTPALAYGNSHGDLIATHTSTGAVVTSTDFGPFGEQLGGALASSVGYQGEWTDPDTGDVNMHARWYQPGAGRFASRDTVTLEPFPSVQANRYTYGNANPVRYIDPSGHKTSNTISCGRLCPSIDYIQRGIQKAENYANKNKGTVRAVGRGVSLIRKTNPLFVFLEALLKPGALANGTCGGPCNYGGQNGPMLGPRNNGPKFATGTAGSIVGGGGGGRWVYVSSGGNPSGGSGGRYIFVPIVVDNRKEILRNILNTPQERPPIVNRFTQDVIDRMMAEAEEDVEVFHVEIDLLKYHEEYGYNVALDNVRQDWNANQNSTNVSLGGDSCKRSISYSRINRKNQQRGPALGVFCGNDLFEGKAPGSKPPGYVAGVHHSGHIMGKQFGARGHKENIVALYALANTPVMRDVETGIANRIGRASTPIDDPESMVYLSTPIYWDDSPVPIAMHLQAVGSQGAAVDRCIINVEIGINLGGGVCRMISNR